MRLPYNATNEEIAIVTATVEAHSLLPGAKQVVRDTIDARSEALIAEGFLFGGKRFSLSEKAQIKWLGLAVGASTMPYPYPVPTLDSKDSFSIPDATTVLQMYGTAMMTVGSILASGTALKAQVNAASNEEELAAVVDTR